MDLHVKAALLVKPDPPIAEDEAQRVTRALAPHRVKVERVTSAEAVGDHDLLIVVGDSAFLLDAVRTLPPGTPVLGVGSAGFGALTEVTVEGFERAARRIANGDFRLEEVDRMECRVGDRARGLALNEAALVPATSGQFVRYSLWVDDELVWRDRGDGVIIATPTGSTAYALAAGGPVVLARTRVFSVVPICSSDANRPFVVNEEAAITVTDVSSAGGVELVLDGRERLRVGRGEVVRVARAQEPARFVRLSEKRYTQVLGRLKTAREVGLALKDAPPSAKFLFKLLEYEGPLTQQEMIRESNLSARTIRNALNYLLEQGVLAKEPNLRDARQDVYVLRHRGATVAGGPREGTP